MNLKEIQDGAPEGATHYNNFIIDNYCVYLIKDKDNNWHLWTIDVRWELLVGNDYDPVILYTAKPLYPTQEPKDPTNPSHYKQGKVECIDAIESATFGKKGIEAVLVGNIIKYLWRYEEKNGIEDVEKAKWYLDKLLEKLK